eukprot:UN22933
MLGEVMKRSHYVSLIIIMVGCVLAVFTGSRSEGDESYNKFIEAWNHPFNITLASCIMVIQLYCFKCAWSHKKLSDKRSIELQKTRRSKNYSIGDLSVGTEQSLPSEDLQKTYHYSKSPVSTKITNKKQKF